MLLHRRHRRLVARNKDKRAATVALNTMDIAIVNVDGEYVVHYVDVLQALVKYIFMMKLGASVKDELDGAYLENPQVAQNIIRKFPDLRELYEGQTTFSFADHFAAVMLQNAWKTKKAQRLHDAMVQMLISQLVVLRAEQGTALNLRQIKEDMSVKEMRAEIQEAAEQAASRAEAEAYARSQQSKRKKRRGSRSRSRSKRRGSGGEVEMT